MVASNKSIGEGERVVKLIK